MDDRIYAFLKWTAIGLGALWVGWSFYDSFFTDQLPGSQAFEAGETLFADGYYDRALEAYEQTLREAPDYVPAMRSKARALMQLERNEEALAVFDQAIALTPEFGATYANRGILHDRMGNYEKAIADYERSLELEPELADGPHWLTRFLRLQPDKPPSVADRARYLRGQLAKPESERVLRVPEEDAAQRSYKQ